MKCLSKFLISKNLLCPKKFQVTPLKSYQKNNYNDPVIIKTIKAVIIMIRRKACNSK